MVFFNYWPRPVVAYKYYCRVSMVVVMNYHKDGTLPLDKDVVWVFGSNLKGIHGSGAAKIALEKYGAIYGRGEGIQGQSYAIPTKITPWVARNIASVKDSINKFIKYSRGNKEKTFFITRVGCGLAGFSDEEIAPLFVGCGDNCNMPDVWEVYF